MIRINLLPQAKSGVATPQVSAGSVRLWFVAYALVALAWLGTAATLYARAQGALDEQLSGNASLQRKLQAHADLSQRLETQKAALTQKRELDAVVAELEKARFGPARMLVELSAVLSPGGGPAVDIDKLAAARQDDPSAGFNRAWDARRLWITGFGETDRNCTIQGRGQTNEDVAEFLRRLSLSRVFDEVILQKTEAIADKQSGQHLIGFILSCKVRY
ncbi:MAG: PilN domain-containing protein [Polyangiales bacterium]